MRMRAGGSIAERSRRMLGTPFVRRMLLLGSALLLIAILLLLPERSFNRARDAEQLVSHTLRVLNASGLLLSTMEDAETGQRGYLLTGDDGYLQPYRSALSKQSLARQDLRQLTADNSGQQARIGKLDQLVETRLSVSSRIIALYLSLIHISEPTRRPPISYA